MACIKNINAIEECPYIVNAKVVFTSLVFTVDEKYDQHVYSDGPQAIVWALGPINGKGEVSYHKLRTKGDLFIDFARAPQWNCPKPDDISTLNDQPRLVAQQR